MKGEKGGERVPVPVAGPAFRGGVYFVLFKLFGCVLEFAFEVVSIESTFSPVCNAGLEGKNRGKPVRWAASGPRGEQDSRIGRLPSGTGRGGPGGGHPTSAPSHALPPPRKGGPCAARRHKAHAALALGRRIASDPLRNTRPERGAKARLPLSATATCGSWR